MPPGAGSLINTVAVVGLAAGAQIVVAHGVKQDGAVIIPDYVMPDRSTDIAVIAMDATNVTFRNLGTTVQTANFNCRRLQTNDRNVPAAGFNPFIWSGNVASAPAAGVAPAAVAAEDANGLAIPLIVHAHFIATGAPADDVVIYDAAVPFNVKLIDYMIRIATASGAGATARVRGAIGGGGVQLSEALATDVATTLRATSAPDVAGPPLLAAGSTVALRRSTGTSVGDLYLWLLRA